jgi:hypothetical protein
LPGYAAKEGSKEMMDKPQPYDVSHFSLINDAAWISENYAQAVPVRLAGMCRAYHVYINRYGWKIRVTLRNGQQVFITKVKKVEKDAVWLK